MSNMSGSDIGGPYCNILILIHTLTKGKVDLNVNVIYTQYSYCTVTCRRWCVSDRSRLNLV